jgi:hypothetical protein
MTQENVWSSYCGEIFKAVLVKNAGKSRMRKKDERDRAIEHFPLDNRFLYSKTQKDLWKKGRERREISQKSTKP